MRRAGFELGMQPGIWLSREGIEVDLLVPDALGGPGRRGARLPEPHGRNVARKVRGLEATLVDHAPHAIGSLDPEPSDTRRFEVEVAGPAALLVAKLHKLSDRSGNADRAADKDALDALRLLRAVPTLELARCLAILLTDELAAGVTEEALELLRHFFGDESAQGTQMTVRATGGLENDATIAGSCAVLSNDLWEAVGRLRDG